jgi:hypothetical protein
MPQAREAGRQIAIAVIWERLAGQHDAAIAYPALRTYVTGRRSSTKTCSGSESAPRGRGPGESAHDLGAPHARR